MHHCFLYQEEGRRRVVSKNVKDSLFLVTLLTFKQNCFIQNSHLERKKGRQDDINNS